MKKIVLLLALAMTICLNAYDAYYTVKQDGTGDFTTIQAAINAVSNNTSAIIYVYGSLTPYTGSNNKNIIWNGNTKNIYLYGVSNLVIDCQNNGRAFTISNGTSEDIIKNFIIINSDSDYTHGGAIILNSGSPQILNNTFEDCATGEYPAFWVSEANGGAIHIYNCTDAIIDDNTFEDNSAFSGGALYIENSSLSLTYNTFLSNSSGHIWDDTDGSTGIAGAVHIESCFDTNISNNLFEANFSNHASAAMAIVNASDNTILEHNTFKENQFGVLNTLCEYVNGILGLYYGEVECRYNLFIDNYAQYYLSHIIDVFNSSSSITNNSFIGNQDVERIISFGYDVVDEEITNCLFLDNESYSISWGDVTLNNCVVYQSGDLGNGVIEGDGCFINIDPLLDSNHQPIWNATQKSPCIDTGNPTSPFDPDETPADIGAVRAVTHDYQLTTAQHDRYRYRSFPVIDRDYIQQGFETTYICAPVEDQTAYFKIFEQYGDYQEWIPSNWTGDLDYLDSVKGYKLKTTSDVEIPTSGRTLPENTQVDLVAGENWVGYFVKESMTIYDAFQDIWDHLEGVYSEDWAWDNSGIIPSTRCVLIYGKMYIVYVDQSCSFVYGDGVPVIPDEREMTDGFYYEETPTYSPINILSLDDPTVLEVGAMLDGECIGATKVEEFPLQILAFPPEGNRGSGDITFEFYCGGRSYTQVSSYQVLNKVTGQYDNSKIELHPYESTSISFGAPIVPIEFTLSGNYPNPFNPSTTISYSLPQVSNVSLNIYNVKGQLVTRLVSESQPEGYYDVVWNGKNYAGKQVSSGIYYYRITACGKTINKKMLMLK